MIISLRIQKVLSLHLEETLLALSCVSRPMMLTVVRLSSACNGYMRSLCILSATASIKLNV